MLLALKRVISNKGSHDVNGMKTDGGIRLLGILTTQDRLIQQAIAQVLSKICGILFSENSFGFHPCRGAKDAIRK
ncbi:hypothetical protein [Clostridium beijerinckii]|uniref:hypothetical protein n=1 Tax=Clostridium beijerinckii TaxID=1520 RepID=UPI001F4C4F80|nr:hypothetical protein [Clostridium beijerinckii]NRT74176.1 retron-type reverse transcriptase [Clostridium beijerinckii]